MEIKASVEEIRQILRYMAKGYKVPKIIHDVIYNTAVREIEEKHKVILIKRDPDVESTRIQGVYVKIIEGECMEISPAAVGGFGADFDGDAMALYNPISREAEQEIKTKLISATRGTYLNAPNFELSKEMLSGLFTLTYSEKTTNPITIKTIEQMKEMEVDIPVIFEGIKTTSGRVIFNSNLPRYYPFINETITKKTVNKILSNIIEKNKNDYVETIKKLMMIGFYYATKYPITLDLDSLMISPKLKKLKEELGKEKDLTRQQKIIDDMETEMLDYIKVHSPDLYNCVKSGASKGAGQLRQIMVSKGIIMNANGEILPPITKAMNDGYSPSEYFEASAGSRAGIIARSISTGKGGYSYRKVVYIAGDVEADVNIVDCGTKKTLDIKMTDDLFKRFAGRNCIQDKKIIPITKDMIGNFVSVRSPIYCKTKAICRTCYGKLLYQIDSRNVGILAAQSCCSLSERIMKAFHLGGVVQLEHMNYLKELMENKEEVFRNRIDKLINQTDNTLITNAETTTLTINKNMFTKDYRINRESNEIILPLGYFKLTLDDVEIPVTIEEECHIFNGETIDESSELITISYTKGSKLLYVIPRAIEPAKVATKIEELVSGNSPYEGTNTIYIKLYKLLSSLGDWDSVHLEVIVSNIMRNKHNPQVLARLKEPYEPTMVSMKTLPGYISWPLALAFENFSQAIRFGLTTDRGPESPIEKVLLGIPLTEEK